MDKKLLTLFSLKWNPFSTEVPPEALLATPSVESFCWRIEHAHIREGGFALVGGAPGTGKSAALRLLEERLKAVGGEVVVGVLEHPQSNVADFYREMGDIFGVQLKPHNRWHGFKSLRARWVSHIEQTLVRPVLLIDEAQEMNPTALSELRTLSSTRFDSRIILSVVLAGDDRLTQMLGRNHLLPLGSRLRTRLEMGQASPEELRACLEHRLRAAGNARLMTRELIEALCDHASGNFRTMMNMGNELLAAAAQADAEQIDEKIFFTVFNVPREVAEPERATKRGKRPSGRARR